MGSLVRSDSMQTVVVDVTALGIMEITGKVCQNPCRAAAPAEEGRIKYA